MVRVGLAAPHFDCCAVLNEHRVRLTWEQLHDNKTLFLLFDPAVGPAHPTEYLIAVSNTVARRCPSLARGAVVCRAEPEEALAWVNLPRSDGGPGSLAFPLVIDPDGRIAALYDLLAEDGTPLWGQILIDPAGVVRRMAVSGFTVCAGVDELLRGIEEVGSPATSGP